MKPDSNEIRIVAVAIRSQRLGFAVLEGSLGLVDWRTVHYQTNSIARINPAMRKMESLLTLSTPSVIVIERSRLLNAQNVANVYSIYRFLRREAKLRSIPMSVMKRKDVRNTFRHFHARSKDAIAATLAQMFPELLPKLPPKRKIWQGENAIMPLFDAIALAVAFWDHRNSQNLGPG
jgi:hypothetical protein